MTDRNDEATGGLDLSRRSLLKKGAATGAVAWTAPMLIDSVFSPAAAASTTFSMTQHRIFSTDTDTTGSHLQSTGALTVGLTAGRLVIITVVAASDASTTISSITGTSISDAVQISSVEFEEDTFRKSTLFVWRATAVGGTGAITVDFLSSGVSTNIISVAQASVPATPNPVLANVITTEGDDNTAEATFAGVTPPSGEFMAIAGNPTQDGDDFVWSDPTPAADWEELQDTYQNSNGNEPNRNLVLATFWRATAVADEAQSTASGFAVGQSVDEWGAIRVEIDP